MKKKTLLLISLILVAMLVASLLGCSNGEVTLDKDVTDFIESELAGLTGDKGDTGDTGAMGEKGEQGIQGIPGEKGDKGANGDKGAKGSDGEQGIQGGQGEQGQAGAPGMWGASGSDGADGLTGACLFLFEKDSSWAVVEGGASAVLYYVPYGTELQYNLEASGLEVDTAYSLIYYADKPDQFVNWGGNNPGAFIASGTSSGEGILSLSGSIELGMSLPCTPDENDTGAKIWLVPTSMLPDPYPGDGSWAYWAVPEILFESETIIYIDTDCGFYSAEE